MAEETLSFIINAQNNAKAVFKEIENNLSSLQTKTQNTLMTWDNAVSASQKLAAGFAVAGTALGAFGGMALKAAANIETQKIGFQTLLGSVEEADEAIKMIQRDAAETPFEFAGLIEANKALTLVTKSATKSEQVLLDVGKALAAAGKGQAELDRIIMNLQQIGNTGRITEMDIRQFGYAGVNILELLADYYGTTKEEASEMIKESETAFDDLAAVFQKAGAEGGRFANAYANATGSVNQMWSNLMDSWNTFLANEGAKLLDWAKQFIGLATNIVQNVLPEWINKMQDFGKWATEHKDVIIVVASALTAMLIPAVISAAAAFASMAVALAPFAIAGGALATLIIAIRDGNVVLAAIAGTITALFIPALLSMAATAITSFLSMIPVIASTALAFAPFLIGGAVIAGLVAGIAWIVQNWDLVKEKTTETWGDITDYLQQTWDGVKIILGEFGDSIRNAWQSLWSGLGNIVNGAWETMIGAIKSSINTVIDKINAFISGLNSAISTASRFTKISFSTIPTIPKLAEGGIVNSPTLAMVGEKEPEAVIPLSKFNGGFSATPVVVNINGGYFLSREVGRELAGVIMKELKRTQKL